MQGLINLVKILEATKYVPIRRIILYGLILNNSK